MSSHELVSRASTRHPKARAPLQTWYTLVGKARWQNFADVRNTCGSADLVNGWVVFDAASYRLVTDVHYAHSRLYIKHVFTHAEYEQWDQDAEMTFEKSALKSAQRHFAIALRALDGLDTEMTEPHAARMTALIDALLEEGTEAGDPLLEFAMTWLSTYEARLPSIPESSPVEVLRFLMETNGLRQKDLAEIMGGQPVVSAVLSGRRDINLRQALALAKRFSVSPALFVAGYEEPAGHPSTKIYSSSQVVHLNVYGPLGIEIDHGQASEDLAH